MPRRATTLVPMLAAVALVATPPGAPAQAPYTPEARTLIEYGPAGRFLLGGTWEIRRSARGRWRPVAVPHAFNARDNSMRSFLGRVVWYRKRFRVPDARPDLTWRIRFESVGYRMRATLNGSPIGGHAGAYLPFELPLYKVRPDGVNELVVRVDNRRRRTDFPPHHWHRRGRPEGGWWNHGGLLREVYVRRIDRVDMQTVLVRPRPQCPRGCAADVDVRVALRNHTDRPQPVTVNGHFGEHPLGLPPVVVPARGTRVVGGRLRVPRPRVWSPANPQLYPVALQAAIGSEVVARHGLRSGIRSVRVHRGRLELNGRPVRLRGVSIHEEAAGRGAALTETDRRTIVALTEAVNATVLRAHYPLHPRLHELADRHGLLVWSEVPMFRMPVQFMRPAWVRRNAVAMVRRNAVVNRNHPSILLWSVGNELRSRPSRTTRAYIRAAAAAARAADPTRPVAIAIEGKPKDACVGGYGPLDVLGLNDYFGWYGGQVTSLRDLGPYLDRMRRCHRRRALFVSEFGAEANRRGSPREKGTYEFQRRWIRYHLRAFDRRRWLSGALYWTLKEFRVRPYWRGGNPKPDPPYHRKGLVRLRDNSPKPAFYDVQASFRRFRNVGG